MTAKAAVVQPAGSGNQEQPKAPNPAPFPRHLREAGWRPKPDRTPESMPKVMYGLVRKGRNFAAVRVEVLKDGGFLFAEGDENLKVIVADRILDDMLSEGGV